MKGKYLAHEIHNILNVLIDVLSRVSLSTSIYVHVHAHAGFDPF